MKIYLVSIIAIIILYSCAAPADYDLNILSGKPLHFGHRQRPHDPYALIQYNGSYHLFLRNANLDTQKQENKLRHLSSSNLIAWKDMPGFSLLYDDSNFYGCFVADSANTSHLGNAKNAPVIALMAVTKDNGGSSYATPLLAYSNDFCKTWTNVTDNLNLPVTFLKIPQNMHVFWCQPTFRWIMSLANNNVVEFYSSADLMNWNFESSFGSDFFSDELHWQKTTLLQLGDEIHWALITDLKPDDSRHRSGGSLYLIGKFDGHNFTSLSTGLHWLDYGRNNYCSTFMLGEDDRKINLLWAFSTDGEINSEKQIFTVPGQVNLDSIGRQLILSVELVSELNSILYKESKIEPQEISGYTMVMDKFKSSGTVSLSFDTREIRRLNFPEKFGVMIENENGQKIFAGFDVPFMSYFIESQDESQGPDGSDIKVPMVYNDSLMSFSVLITPTYLRYSALNGKLIMTKIFKNEFHPGKVFLYSENGSINLVQGSLSLYEVKR